MREMTSGAEMKESGVLDKTALVFGQMNEPPGARMRVAETGLTMAEYFRDQEQQRCTCFLLIIFSVLYRLVLRCLHFWDVCRLQ